MNEEIAISASGANSGGGGGSRRSEGAAFQIGEMSGRVDGMEKSIDALTKAVNDTGSEVAVLRATLEACQESVARLEKTVIDQLQKLIDASSDGIWKAFRDSLRQDPWIRRAFWGITILIFASTAMTVSIRLFGHDAVQGGIDATRALKGTQTEMMNSLPAGVDPTGE